MDNIKIAINEAKGLLEGHISTYNTNEQAVCDHIILPILNALGWRSTPHYIIPKSANDERRFPDYTLQKNEKKVLIVEVKKSSVKIDSADVIKQLADYCYSQSTDYGILTNGLEWLLFETFQKDKAQRIVWKINILKDDIEKVSNFLYSINFVEIESLGDITEKTKALEKAWSLLLTDKNLIAIILSPIIDDLVRKNNPAINLDSVEIEVFLNYKLNEPSLLTNIISTTPSQPTKIETRKNETTNGSTKKITGGQFVHISNGDFYLSSDPKIKIDVMRPIAEVIEQLKKYNLHTTNPTSFYHFLRQKSGTVIRRK